MRMDSMLGATRPPPPLPPPAALLLTTTAVPAALFVAAAVLGRGCAFSWRAREAAVVRATAQSADDVGAGGADDG